jgi:type I restriction enzyme M protein
MDDMDQASVKAGGEASFFIEDLAKYAWSNLMSTRMGNQEKMDLYSEALTKFSEAKQLPELFRTIFRAAFLPYRSPETLGLFLKEIAYFDYSHPEELGNAYEYLLSIMSSQGDAGQFRTPRHIIDFIVAVVNPKKDDKILDPACGTAGFLVSAYNHILEQHDGKNDPNELEKPLTPDERKKLMSNLEGYDIDPTMVRIAQVNMYLHQFKNPQIFQYDSLTNEERWNDKFDVILANPPFMSPKGGIKPHNRFGLSSNRAEVLFIDYIINHLKPKGRAGIVIPEGIVFQSGKAYKELRKNLVENGLYAVVSLPSGVFQPYSGVKTSILFFNNEVAKKSAEILFVKISSDGFHLSASRKASGKNDLPIAFSEISKFATGTPIAGQIAFTVPKVRISEDENYFLSSERYQENVEHSGKADFVAIEEILEIAPNEKVGEQEVPIMSITMARGLIDQGDKFKRRIASESISDYKLVRRNNLVVGFPIDEGVLGFQQKYDLAAVSPAYGIWKLTNGEGINLDYLEKILRSPQMREIFAENMQGAVSRRRSVPKDVFLKLRIPIPPLPEQERLVDELAGYEAVISGAKQVIENWRPNFDFDPSWKGEELGTLSTLEYGLGESAKETGKFRFIRITDIDESGLLKATEPKYIDLNDSELGYVLNKGDVLIARTGATYGKCLYFDSDTPSVFAGYLIRVKLVDKVSSQFFWMFTQSSNFDAQKKRLVSGGGQPQFNANALSKIIVPVPPMDVQERLVAELLLESKRLDLLRELILSHEVKIQKVLSRIWGTETS